MQTALVPHAHPDAGTHKNSPASMPSTLPIRPSTPAHGPSRQPRHSNLDALLKSQPVKEHSAAREADLEPTPGIFLGLRVALFFNAGLGIAALLAYEAWSMLAP